MLRSYAGILFNLYHKISSCLNSIRDGKIVVFTLLFSHYSFSLTLLFRITEACSH